MKSIFVIAGLIIIVTLSDCKKSPPVYHDPIDTFLLNNFNYRPGTYWIYKDSITGEEDSFYVHDQSFYSASNSSNLTSDVVNHSKIDIFQNNGLKSKVATWTMDMSFHEIDMHYIGDIEIIYSGFIVVPYNIGLIGYNNSDSSYVVSTNNSYTIKGNVYENVIETKDVDDIAPYYAHFDNTFFFNSDVGIIKMILHQSSVNNIFELSRYHLVKK